MKREKFKEVLVKILDSLEEYGNIIWRLEGSANLLVQGVPTQVRDLDITTNEEGIKVFRKALEEFVVKDFYNEHIHAHSLICNMDGVEVEINVYDRKELNMFNNIEDVIWEGLNLPVLPLESSKRFYELIGRKEKVNLILTYLD